MTGALAIARGAWRYRDFIVASVKREFASRYLGTQLGFFWIIAQPLALIAIYTIVFAEIMKPALPGHSTRFAYSIYLTAGLITWTLFGDLLGRSVGIFVNNANLLKKVSIPKITLPAIASLSAILNYSIVLAIFLVFMALSGNWPGWPLLGMVPVVAVLALFAMGLGLLLSTVNVFYRDVEQSMAIVLQFWFWLTPIVYPAAALPETVKAALSWNPMAPLVAATQGIFLERRLPHWDTLLYPTLVALGLAVLAHRVFLALADELVDEL